MTPTVLGVALCSKLPVEHGGKVSLISWAECSWNVLCVGYVDPLVVIGRWLWLVLCGWAPLFPYRNKHRRVWPARNGSANPIDWGDTDLQILRGKLAVCPIAKQCPIRDPEGRFRGCHTIWHSSELCPLFPMRLHQQGSAWWGLEKRTSFSLCLGWLLPLGGERDRCLPPSISAVHCLRPCWGTMNKWGPSSDLPPPPTSPRGYKISSVGQQNLGMKIQYVFNWDLIGP